MTQMFMGTYRGDQPFLVGRRAALRWSPETERRMDSSPVRLAYGWHPFPRSDFDLDPPIDWRAR